MYRGLWGSYESEQEVEITGPNETYHAPIFTLSLVCTCKSQPQTWEQPSEAAEFEVVGYAIGKEELTYKQFCETLGDDVANAVIERAMNEANETADF